MADRTPPVSGGERPTNQRLVVLALAGALCLNYPLLFVFGDSALLFGIPGLYLYLFGTWAAFIALNACILDRSAPGGASPAPPDREHEG